MYAMRPLRIHGPVFLLLLIITFAVFGRLMTTPVWNPTDAQVLCDGVGGEQPGRCPVHRGDATGHPMLTGPGREGGARSGPLPHHRFAVD